ncbi:flavoprotein [Streptomyces sp. B6B3]|uniref:flavoprotein n=1 Tax=Streptomyces sp. B6B3 TaxID=3153570 RepID=UPI00325E3476
MTTNRVLYLLACAARPALTLGPVIDEAKAAGWDVCLGLTPAAERWVSDQLPELEKLTGKPVRSRFRFPSEPDVWPHADVVLVAPATFNTINEWALGIASKFVVGYAVEARGKGVPVVTMPCVNEAYARHTRFLSSIETLRDMGIRVLHGDTGPAPHEPGQGPPPPYPWHLALAALPKPTPA